MLQRSRLVVHFFNKKETQSSVIGSHGFLLNAFFHFLLAMGRYTEACLYLYQSPLNCPSTHPESLLDFFALMRYPAGEPIPVYGSEDEILQYADGTMVTGLGRWNIRGNEERFCSAVSRFHMHRTGKFYSFTPACADCIALRLSLGSIESQGAAGPHTMNGCPS
jgi:hypothetical protein